MSFRRDTIVVLQNIIHNTFEKHSKVYHVCNNNFFCSKFYQRILHLQKKITDAVQ